MEWNWKWGMTSVCAWVETPKHYGDKFTDVAEMADNDRLYCESAYNNYPAALAEIQRLQEKLKEANSRIIDLEFSKQNLESELISKTIDLEEANDRANELYCELEKWKDSLDPRDAEIENMRERIAELEAQQEWHDASDPPDDVRWVIVEMKDGDEKFVMPCWYADKYWHVEHFRMGDILRWRELPGVGG